MSIEILKKELKQNIIRNMYLFYGPEEYLKKYYSSLIEEKLVPKELEALNTIVMEGKVDTGKLAECCNTTPFMSEKKVVIIKNSGFFKTKGRTDEEGKSKGAGSELVAFLQNIPDYTCLLFVESEIDKRLKIVDAVKNNGLVVEFPVQKSTDLAKWVINILNSRKKQIDMMCASRIVENCEPYMNDIINELEKLILYTGDRPSITGKDVESICTKTIKGRIFDLTDALSEKNAEKSFKILDDLLSLREPMPRILFMITRHFRQILEMKLLRDEGLSEKECITRMEINPYAAGKLSKYCRLFDINVLKKIINECLEYDVAIKTGGINDRIAAELLIAEFCAGGAGNRSLSYTYTV